jgi:hypothetical protein
MQTIRRFRISALLIGRILIAALFLVALRSSLPAPAPIRWTAGGADASANLRRDMHVAAPSSSPAKAGDPVHAGFACGEAL